VTYPDGLSDLQHVALDGSYVLGVTATPGSVVIAMELLLLPTHRLYCTPAQSERACFSRAELQFSQVKQLLWKWEPIQPASDATGEIDFGHVERFERVGDVVHIDGEFGALEIKFERIELRFERSGA
jgi:hypothetical protein